MCKYGKLKWGETSIIKSNVNVQFRLYKCVFFPIIVIKLIFWQLSLKCKIKYTNIFLCGEGNGNPV